MDMIPVFDGNEWERMGTNPGEGDRGKSERQALYLAYRAMPLRESDKRMTQAEAARLAGVESKTVSRWKQEDERFRAMELEVLRNGIDQARKLAKAGTWALLGEAIYQLATLLQDDSTPAQVRASIALKILEWNGASGPVEIELSGDPWGELLKQLVDEQGES